MWAVSCWHPVCDWEAAQKCYSRIGDWGRIERCIPLAKARTTIVASLCLALFLSLFGLVPSFVFGGVNSSNFLTQQCAKLLKQFSAASPNSQQLAELGKQLENFSYLLQIEAISLLIALFLFPSLSCCSAACSIAIKDMLPSISSSGRHSPNLLWQVNASTTSTHHN